MSEAAVKEIVWYGLMALAGGFLLAGAILLLRARSFLARSVRTTGIVLDVSTHWHEGTTTYRPRVGYTDIDGVERQGKTPISASNYDFAPGSEVEIRYDPARPERVVLVGSWLLFVLPIIFLGVGALLAVIFLSIRGEFFG